MQKRYFYDRIRLVQEVEFESINDPFTIGNCWNWACRSLQFSVPIPAAMTVRQAWSLWCFYGSCIPLICGKHTSFTTSAVKHVLLQFEDIEERHLSSVHLLQFIGIACEIYAQTQRITMVTEKSPARLGSLKIPSPPSTHQNMNFQGPVLRHNYIWCILCVFSRILGVPPVPDWYLQWVTWFQNTLIDMRDASKYTGWYKW
jgi:hypothetical protein